MILECPECSTRYLVPDSAIGSAGRTVRCAQCRHSWFQAATEPAAVGGASPVTTAPAGKQAVPPSEPEPIRPIAEPDAPAVAIEKPISPPPRPFDAEAAPAAPSFQPYAETMAEARYEPDVPARRNPARRRTAAAIGAGLLMLGGTGAIVYIGAPGIAGRLGLPGGGESPLRIKDNPIERRELDNGSELFAVSGQVLNPSGAQQRVPDIRAELRDEGGRLVYSWMITPQRRSLAPGGAIDFNSAKLDVPANSKRLELSFAGQDG